MREEDKRRCYPIKSDLMINEQIHVREVRLMGVDREPLGVVSIQDALAKAEEANLDLVMIAPQGEPPVCRIMDYSKYRFEQAKKDKDARKNQKVISVKEVRLSPSIEEHDIDVKAKAARKFVEDGDKVKVTVQFRGRQMAHTEVGYVLLGQFTAKLEDVANVEKKPLLEGRNMSMILVSKSAK
jgi:translation initiation factor IF-3